MMATDTDKPYVPAFYECQYCGAVILEAEVSRNLRPPPAATETWAMIASYHEEDCDWVAHRSFQR